MQKDIKQIIFDRTNLFVKAKDNLELQKIELQLCKRDILYRFDNYVYTDKNTSLYWWDLPNVLPMVLYEFQREMVTEIRESITEASKPVEQRDGNILLNVFLEKSRQMGASWVIMAVYTYWYIFYNHKYHCISQKEKDVDEIWNIRSLLWKVRFILKNLPLRMLPQWYTKDNGSEFNKKLHISRADWTWAITWESAHPDASRSWTYNSIFMDEMAFMDYATTINTAATMATSCRIMTSTPNGMSWEFYRMRLLTQKRVWIDGSILPPEIKGLRYHRKDHPLYTMDWYREKVKWMSKEKIAQELEIDYNTAIIGRVYSEFPSKPIPIIYDITKPLYVLIDNSHWWQDPNAIIVLQQDWVYREAIDCVQVWQPPEFCAEYLIWQPKFAMTPAQEQFMQRFQSYNRKKATYITDPYDVDSALWSSTIRKDYQKVWINLVSPKDKNKESQILKTRTNMYRIKRNEQAREFANAIMNSKYPERKENSQSTKENLSPLHDQFSHYRTALEYWVTYLLDNMIEAKKHKVELSDKPMHNSYLYNKR